MAMKNVFCPECGQPTTINSEKPFCFCLQCGNKIEVSSPVVASASESRNSTSDNDYSAPKKTEDEIGEKLKEVAFYYQLSFEKGEYKDKFTNPTYYIKAQDVLVDLSQKYPDDYRIWWEMCKPVDFMHKFENDEIYGDYSINEDFFHKALDKADISIKRTLIAEHDNYLFLKEAQAQRIKEKILIEQEKVKKEQEERRKRLEIEQEERRLALENERKMQLEQQKQRQIEYENAKKQAEQERLNNLSPSQKLWNRLSACDYRELTEHFAITDISNSQKLFITFGISRLNNNILSVSAYIIETDKKGVQKVYKEQDVYATVDNQGNLKDMNKRIFRLLPMHSHDNSIRFFANENNEVFINGMKLEYSPEYIASVVSKAKTPFVASKIFG